jgi:nanoRNase/pAp phosphatase (c-di-AMP/oligoRNAs hydrolase)
MFVVMVSLAAAFTQQQSYQNRIRSCQTACFAKSNKNKRKQKKHESKPRIKSAVQEKEITTPTKSSLTTYSSKFLDDNGILIHTEDDGRVTATMKSEEENYKQDKKRHKPMVLEQPAKMVPKAGFNVVLTHCTADFDSLASAVGLAKLWSNPNAEKQDSFDSSSSNVPTFVVLPRGAHPGVQRFLALHKHLFPIRSLKSLPTDLSGLNRLGLVDAQRRDRIGPAEHLLGMAKRVTVVDHHIDSESDIPEATDYVVDQVGSVSTIIVERLKQAQIDLTEAEATLLALGIHADTGSLCYDSTTARDAQALAWAMEQGASQPAIAENVQTSLSQEQQGVLTQALINTNSTVIHGVTVSTVLLSADGFINGLAAVTQDALELSSSDVFLLSLVYEARSGGRSKKGQGERVMSRLLSEKSSITPAPAFVFEEEAWKGGVEALRRRRLQAAFDRKDTNHSGFLEKKEISAALAASGVITSEESVDEVMNYIDTDGDGKVDFEEFVAFAEDAEERQKEKDKLAGRQASTMIIIGRVKAGVNMKSVRLNKLFEPFGGGGHAKAASATVRLSDESEAEGILQGIVDTLIETSLMQQPTVGEFMTAPVLSAKPHMTEKQVEDLFTRYDVRALPVIDDNNDVIGLVTYKEVAAAKQRLFNKEQKRQREEAKRAAEDKDGRKKDKRKDGPKTAERRKLGSALKGWMKQHVQIIEASVTMAEAEATLLANDVGCIPVVEDGTKKLVGMVTRTDLLRQHRYYPSLHYHNKGFSDSIAKRQPIIELRKRLKQFDLEDE